MSNKRVLCIQDMAGIGRSSLTVISPVLSVKGIQCVPMPTMVLSTHYGGFGTVARQDLTQFCFDTLNEYRRIGVEFEGVLSGFIANEAQAELVKSAFEYAKTAVKICDPVMADNGKYYSSVTDGVAQGIKQICRSSDVITPNTTEANILLGRDIEKQLFSEQEITEIALQLKEEYNCSVVITGAKLQNGDVVCCVAQKDKSGTGIVKCSYVPVHFPGTGDLFAATMTAYILDGLQLTAAVEKACRFVEICVKNTWKDKDTDTRFGVEVEQNLKYLLD